MNETEMCFVSINMEKMGKIMDWLNALVGKSSHQGQIIKIISWQVVSTGRPYEYSAIAQVEVKK
jgi:hypothetical protein